MTADSSSRYHAQGTHHFSNHHGPVDSKGIGAEINARTRLLHTELNKLIIERLALALPPIVRSPVFYAAGLEAFANVYFAFELEWDRIASTFGKDLEDRKKASSWDRKFKRTESIVNLRPHGLERSTSLRKDLRYLHNALYPVTNGCEAESVAAAQGFQWQKLHVIGPAEKRYIARIHEVVSGKPHLLIAYAWVMYLAIFSGGRWIRARLKAAGRDFWKRQSEFEQNRVGTTSGAVNTPRCTQQYSGFEFLHFADGTDGEDIKKEFKSRLSIACEDLTSSERAEILDEAEAIFNNTIALVKELDETVPFAKIMAFSNHNNVSLPPKAVKTRFNALEHKQHTTLKTLSLIRRRILYYSSIALFSWLFLISLVSLIFYYGCSSG